MHERMTTDRASGRTAMAFIFLLLTLGAPAGWRRRVRESAVRGSSRRVIDTVFSLRKHDPRVKFDRGRKVRFVTGVV
jgi:hypothetical protein